MKTLSLWIAVWMVVQFSGSANAAERVRIPFSAESSIEWVRLMHPEMKASSASCAAEALRPTIQESAIVDPSNRVICETDASVSVVDSLENDPVEAWGTRFEKYHFEFSGAVASAWWKRFKTKAKGMSEYDSSHGIWSRIIICDPNDNFCMSTYSLNDEASEMSSGKVLCTQRTGLKRGTRVLSPEQDAEIQESENPSQSYEDLIDAQLKGGVREVLQTNCVVLN